MLKREERQELRRAEVGGGSSLKGKGEEEKEEEEEEEMGRKRGKVEAVPWNSMPRDYRRINERLRDLSRNLDRIGPRLVACLSFNRTFISSMCPVS